MRIKGIEYVGNTVGYIYLDHEVQFRKTANFKENNPCTTKLLS